MKKETEEMISWGVTGIFYTVIGCIYMELNTLQAVIVGVIWGIILGVSFGIIAESLIHFWRIVTKTKGGGK